MVQIIQVHDQNHQIVREFQEPIDEPFIQFCRIAEPLGVRYVASIGPYLDSMRNYMELIAWLEDFPKVIESDRLSVAQRHSAQRVLAAAREAADLAGYVYFVG